MKKTLLSFLGAGLIFFNNCSHTIIKTISYSNFPDNPIVRECFNEAAFIKYKEEPDNEDYWQSPEETEKLGTGDCEDKAFYLHYQLKKNKIESEVIFGYVYPSDFFDRKKNEMHSWVEYKQKGETYILDPTAWFIEKRRYIPRDRFIPINSYTYDFINKKFKISKEYINEKIKEFESRNKIKNMNKHYNHKIPMNAKKTEKSQE